MNLISLVNENLLTCEKQNIGFCHTEIINAVQNEVERIYDCPDIGEYEKDCYVRHVLKIAEELLAQQKKRAFLSDAVGFLNELSKTVAQIRKS